MMTPVWIFRWWALNTASLVIRICHFTKVTFLVWNLHVVEAFLSSQLLCQLSPFKPSPCNLYKASSPCPRLVGIVPESMLKFLAMEAFKLIPTNLRSSARSANASTLVIVFMVRVEDGRFRLEVGIKVQVNNSFPQKSPGLRVMELKKLDWPPLAVELSSWPLMMKSISFTGSPSRTIYASWVLKDDTRRSHMASKSWSSICEKKGTWKM